MYSKVTGLRNDLCDFTESKTLVKGLNSQITSKCLVLVLKILGIKMALSLFTFVLHFTSIKIYFRKSPPAFMYSKYAEYLGASQVNLHS